MTQNKPLPLSCSVRVFYYSNGEDTKTAYICPLQFAAVFTFVFWVFFHDFDTSKIYKSLVFVVVALIFLIVLLVVYVYVCFISLYVFAPCEYLV